MYQSLIIEIETNELYGVELSLFVVYIIINTLEIINALDSLP